jgi:hypothetical protein
MASITGVLKKAAVLVFFILLALVAAMGYAVYNVFGGDKEAFYGDGGSIQVKNKYKSATQANNMIQCKITRNYKDGRYDATCTQGMTTNTHTFNQGDCPNARFEFRPQLDGNTLRTNVVNIGCA